MRSRLLSRSKAKGSVQAGADKGKKPKKRSEKATAPEYVSKLELSSEKIAPVVELAERFEHKAFLPTFGDIAHFCQMYGIEVPASKTRASAIPRVFKHIAAMETEEIQRILDDGLFSRPIAFGAYCGCNPAQWQKQHPCCLLSSPRLCSPAYRETSIVRNLRQRVRFVQQHLDNGEFSLQRWRV